MKNKISDIQKLRSYLLLWFTQMISGLGSAMTAYALVIWSYTQSGLALQTALLMVCSYAPYVLCSIFAGGHSATAGTKRKPCWYATRWQHSAHWWFCAC